MTPYPNPKSLFYLLLNDNADKSTILSLFEQVNWESFVQTAQEEKLLPLLYYACKQKYILQLMLPSVVATLQSAYINNMGRTFYLKKALSEVLKAFNDQHVKTMLLKGGAQLVETVYPDINTRMMSDIDFMVHPEDIPRVKQIFQGLGYTCIPDPWGETVKMNFIKGQFDFELHTRPFSDRLPAILPPEEMWEKAVEKLFGEATVHVPAPDDLLYHCIFHELILHDHFFDLNLSTLYEVDRMLKANWDKTNWSELFDRARKYRLDVHFSYFFKELERTFHTPLPESFKKRMQNTVSLMNPFYQNVLNLPGFLRNAGKRFFNFTIIHEPRRHYLRKFYAYFVLSELRSPDDKILSCYGLPYYMKPFSSLVKIIHIGRIIVLHVAVSCIYQYREMRRGI